MWSILQEIRECEWERKYYLWFGTNKIGLGYDVTT